MQAVAFFAPIIENIGSEDGETAIENAQTPSRGASRTSGGCDERPTVDTSVDKTSEGTKNAPGAPRHLDAGYEKAIRVVQERGVRVPRLLG